uniref:Putative zinc finger, CCHC-type n=1 Tax=Tanacetum cinerariifolium TaxID=118510 RepID=A0A6L2K573_TANCI|nr:putative zinc finger, CCHC-type [Tanacetum cinerariifolium]
MQEKHLDNIRKCQSLKRKPISLAQAKKNIIVYLNNIDGYKMQHFKGMTYDQVRPIFEREYNNVQTFLKSDRDEEPTKKRVAKETLLQESFKKLRAEVEVLGSHSTQEETPNVDPKEMSEEDVKNMLEIVPVAEFKVEALQVKYPLIDWEIHFEGSRYYWKIIRVGDIIEAYQSFEDMLKGFDREDLDALWRLVCTLEAGSRETRDQEACLALPEGLLESLRGYSSDAFFEDLCHHVARGSLELSSTLTSNTGYLSEIVPLTGANFSTWRDQVKLTLGVMDLNHALRIDHPAALTAESIADQKRVYEQWERSNRMFLMIIKNSIFVAIRGVIPDSENAKEYLSSVEEQFKGTSKAHASTLILKMLTTKYDGGFHTIRRLKRNQRMVKVWNGVDLNVEAIGTLSLILEGGFCLNLYGTLYVPRIGGHKSFITFTDDYSCYMYLFLINEKFESLDIFKTFKAKVENQLDRKIKVVRSDTGGEYYGRHTDVGQAPGSFFGFCKDHGIINQYTMPGTPQQNGVAERRNRTLMDMDVITYDQSSHWREAMKDELNSMSKNNVWEFVELPKGAKPVRCKWVFKTKLDPNGNIERYKARLVAKGYTKKESVDYKETFSPISRKDSLRIIMALVAHFDLELHQLDVKTAFLNEDVYMAQPQVKKKHNFIKNQVDRCVYLKMSGSNFIILVLYVDDILLASNNIDLLHESKRFLSRNFDMKDLGEASYVIGIEIHQDRANGKLGLSQKAYIERVLNRFNMQQCSPTVAPVIKGDVFGSHQCLKTKVEYEEMNQIPYASVVGSLTYAQVCTRPDIAYICGMLGRPLKIYYDNSAIVSFSNGNSSTGAGLYLDTRYLFVRKRVEEQRISIEHIRTREMLADPLTKAGGKDRPPMLAPGNYVQWKSIIKIYIDTKPNHELIHYCLKNPPYKFTGPDKEVPISEGSSVTTTETYMENYKNVSQDIRDQLNAEAEAVQIIFTGIDNDIYSTFDACPNACEIWKAIERKFTSRDGESLESCYSIFYKMMNELVRNQCDVTNHQVNVQFLLQLQPEWQRSQQGATRNRGKAIVNSPQPIYDEEPSMVAEDDEIGAGYDNQRLGNVAGARETVGTTVVQKSEIQCYNCKEFGHVTRECQKPKRAKDAAYHRENMLLVILTTNVSRPQLKSNLMKDRVLLNNSQVKKQEVEDHRRNVKFSKNKTCVTACNDSLKAKTLNVNFVCATCGKCVLNEKHDMCVLKPRNGVNSRTKMPIAVPVSSREPKRTVKQSVAKHLRKTVASETINQKPRNITRKLYERVSKACSWWYPKFTPSGYTWKPNSKIGNVNQNLIEIVLFIVDSGCSKHMTGNLKLLINFVEKFLGTMKFRNDQIAPILGYGDLVQGAVMIKRVYYVKGLNHNLFFVGQFCDADLEVAFRKSTCYIHDLKGNDLLIGTEFLNKTLHAYFASKGILHQMSVARTPEQNGVVKRRNRTLVKAARTMLSTAKVPLFFWAKAITTSCFTQNRFLVISRHEKTPYHIINDRKPSVKFFHIFGSLCYIVRDGENLDKMKEKGDACIFVGYSTQSRAYRVFNKRTRVIVKTIHVNFDELPQMASDHVSSDPEPQC